MLNAVDGWSVRFTDWPQSRTSPVAVPFKTTAKRSSILCLPLGQALETVTTGFGSTHVFVACAELPPVPVVWRLSVRPLTERVTLALMVVVPATADVRSTVQSPVVPTVVHGFGEVNAPGPLAMLKVICVPAGAFTKPLPSFRFTCAVSVCVVPTVFVAVAGAIWIFASTTRNDSHAPVEAAYVASPE
jgi:hypothetical protein